jgi:hypothetical protein
MKEFFARKCAHTKKRNVIETIEITTEEIQTPYTILLIPPSLPTMATTALPLRPTSRLFLPFASYMYGLPSSIFVRGARSPMGYQENDFPKTSVATTGSTSSDCVEASCCGLSSSSSLGKQVSATLVWLTYSLDGSSIPPFSSSAVTRLIASGCGSMPSSLATSSAAFNTENLLNLKNTIG